MSEFAVVFAINAVAAFFKSWVYPKWGKVGVQVSVFLAATLAALFVTYGNEIMGLKTVVAHATALFSLAVGFYEVLLSRFSLFKQPEVVREG